MDPFCGEAILIGNGNSNYHSFDRAFIWNIKQDGKILIIVPKGEYTKDFEQDAFIMSSKQNFKILEIDYENEETTLAVEIFDLVGKEMEEGGVLHLETHNESTAEGRLA